jgi:putative ABC transport system permease protein
MLESIRYDVRHAVRGLLRDRAFTVVALLSIGLGVGANSAIFSLVDQALYRRLPVREPEQLVLLNWNGSFIGAGWGSANLFSNPMFRQLKAENQVFEGMFARHPTTTLFAVDGGPVPVNTEIVSGSYFGVLGVRPALGRLLDESDDVTPSGHPVVALSYDFWKTKLGGRADIVGRKVLMNNFPMTVVGVAAEGFRGVDFGELPAVFVPTMMKKQATPDFDWLDDPRGRWLHIFGRLKPDESRVQAAAWLQPWFKGMLAADMKLPSWPVVTDEQVKRYLASTLDLLPAASGRSDLRRRLEQPLLVLLAATGLVLLLACLNVANLCLARAFARRRETALRLAIGASRGRIVRELLVQSGLLALLGALAGMALAPIVTSGLVSFLPDAVDLSTAVNPRVFGFALAAALSTGLLFGLVPALQASRTQPGFTLKEEALSVARGLGLRKVLVMGQITLALVLLSGAGLFVRTLSNLRERGPGFSMTNLLMFGVDTGRSGYSQAQGRRVMVDLLRSLRELPEVESAGIATATLLGGGSWNQNMTIESDHRFVSERNVHIAAISPGFFATLKTPLLEGRDFDDRDALEGSKLDFRSAIVNESFARRNFGDRSPIGAHVGFGDRPDTKANVEIVGVVKTFSYRGIRQDDDQLFAPFFESTIGGGSYYVRTRTPSTAAFAAIRSTAERVDPAVPITSLRTVDDQLDRSLSNERLLAILAAAFAGLAVLLAVVGLYGVTSFVVSRRTREIGIRMALGATRSSALWLVVSDAAAMVLGGITIALPALWGLGRLVESQLFGVAATDGATIAGATALVAFAALAAAALPARRATLLNPVEALRVE